MAYAATAWYSRVPTIAQTVFWVVVTVVTVATYAQARKTVLQPLHLEVFKRQLDLLSAVLAELVGKGEVELREKFALSDVFYASAQMMYDDYAYAAFRAKPKDPDSRLYSHDKCPVWRVPAEHLELLDSHTRVVENRPLPTDNEPSWEADQRRAVAIPRKNLEAVARFQGFLEDPLLPSACAALIDRFVSAADDGIEAVSTVLDRRAQEMPAKYPTYEALTDSSSDWLYAEWTSEVPSLQPLATDIIVYCRRYFGSDSMLPANKRGRAFSKGSPSTDAHVRG